MDVTVPLWLLITLTTSIFSIAGFALGAWRAVSASTRAPKRPTSPSVSEPSALASLQADQAALYSTLEKLTTTVKRLSSRQGMRDARAEPGVPPLGASKADLRAFYGVNGMSGPQQARFQLDKEPN